MGTRWGVGGFVLYIQLKQSRADASNNYHILSFSSQWIKIFHIFISKPLVFAKNMIMENKLVILFLTAL